jgi:hypothetical protein
LQDCEQVGRNLAKARSSTASGDSYTNWRCVQTRVLVPKS